MKTVVTLAALFFSISLTAQFSENIRIKSLSSKPIVQVEINGKKGYFIVDTGSDISIINTTQLRRYDLESKKVYNTDRRAIGINGRTEGVMKIDKVKVDLSESFAHDTFYSLNIDRIATSIEAKTNYRIVGIIGADVLIKYNCIIDYNQRHITLISNRSSKRLAAK